MAFSMNQIIIAGNVSLDPELRYTPNKHPVCTLSVATNRSIKRGDDYDNEATFHRIVVWGKMAEFVERTLRKGDQVFITGRMEYRKWEDKNGNKRTTPEIVASNVIPGKSKFDSEIDETTKQDKKMEQDVQEDIVNPDNTPAGEDVDPDEIPF